VFKVRPAKVVCFGEIMLRLSTPGHQRFVQAQSFDATYGGGEANVAISLANYGLDSYFVSKVPDNPIGQAAVNHLRRFGVKSDYVVKGGGRLGIYFLESGASQRPSQVVYDRADSSLARAKPGDFDWAQILAGARAFHFTGITPALGDDAAAVTLEAAKAARRMGVLVSCDLNYRKKLWSRDKANRVMSELAGYVDLCVANEEDAEMVFGIKAAGADVERGVLDDAGYRHVAGELAARFGFKWVGITLRESLSASDNGWSALVYDGTDYFKSRRYDVHIVDRVGAGDAFSGGMIYAFVTGKGPREAVEFAAAASCLKHSIPGDFNMVTVQEVEALAGGEASGRVQR